MHFGELNVLIEGDEWSAQSLKFMALEAKCFQYIPITILLQCLAQIQAFYLLHSFTVLFQIPYCLCSWTFLTFFWNIVLYDLAYVEVSLYSTDQDESSYFANYQLCSLMASYSSKNVRGKWRDMSRNILKTIKRYLMSSIFT